MRDSSPQDLHKITLVTAATAILARHKSSQKIGDENEERAERTVVSYDMNGL